MIFKKIAKKIKKTEKILILGITYKKDVNDVKNLLQSKFLNYLKTTNIIYFTMILILPHLKLKIL